MYIYNIFIYIHTSMHIHIYDIYTHIFTYIWYSREKEFTLICCLMDSSIKLNLYCLTLFLHYSVSF